METLCNAVQCGNIKVSHGYCDKHRKRLSRGQPLEDRKVKEGHPLLHTWLWMKRMEAKFSVCEQWKDFWTFVTDVGERPSAQHQLRRKDPEGNYSPSNCYWVETFPSKDRAEYARHWRTSNPDKAKNNDLKKSFGIGLDEYNMLLLLQEGGCAICGNLPDKQSLAVDHCHVSGKVRGLLCGSCNQGLGRFKDSPMLLSKAINYLDKHK